MVRELHCKIEMLKQSREWAVRYVTVADLIKQERKETLQEGLQEDLRKGQQYERKTLLDLIALMTKDNRGGEIPKLSSDSTFLEEMRVHYQL